MMNTWRPVLTALVVLCSTQHTDGLASVVGNVRTPWSSSVGCLSGKQAMSANEEILRLFESAQLADSLTVLTSNINPQLQACFKSENVPESLTTAMLEVMGQKASKDRTQFIRSFVDAYKEIVTQLIGQAIEVDKTVKEVNDKRNELVSTTTMFKEIWENIRGIRLEHERTLEIFDIFLKDSIMQKSAKIGCYVREGNQNDRWTVAKVKTELMKEMDGVKKMINSVLSHSGSFNRIHGMLNEMIENYVASQVYSALRKTKLENAMLSDLPLIQRFEKYSELTISDSLRDAMRLMYASMTVGYEKAEEYAAGVNTTLTNVEKAMQSIDSVTIKTKCEDANELARSAGEKMVKDGIASIKEGPSKTAAAYKEVLETFIKDQAVPKMQIDIPPAAALKVIMRSLPSREDRKAKLEEAYQFLAKFFGNPVEPSYTLVDSNSGAQGGGYTVDVVQPGGYSVVPPSGYSVSPGGYTVVMGDAVKKQTIIVTGVVTVDQTNQILKPVENMIAKPWITASSHVKHLREVFRCYRKIVQIVGRVIQGCKDGSGSFDELYTKYTSSSYIDRQNCSQLVMLDIPSKDTVRGLLSRASQSNMFNFNSNDCRQNKQRDDPGYVYNDDDDYDDDDDDDNTVGKLSPTQRLTVCDLRKRSKNQSQIAKMIKMDGRLIGSVRCKPSQTNRRHKVIMHKVMSKN